MSKKPSEREEITLENIRDKVDFSKTTDPKSGRGLVAAIVQDEDTKDVLMLAWMDTAGLETTLRERKAAFYSRSRQTSWVKGETSGNFMEVSRVEIDCDQDALILKVKPQGEGNACHTNERSCFYRGFDLNQA